MLFLLRQFKLSFHVSGIENKSLKYSSSVSFNHFVLGETAVISSGVHPGPRSIQQGQTIYPRIDGQRKFLPVYFILENKLSCKLPRGSFPSASQNVDKVIVTKTTVTLLNTHSGREREELQAFYSYLTMSSSFLKYWVTF